MVLDLDRKAANKLPAEHDVVLQVCMATNCVIVDPAFHDARSSRAPRR